MSEVEEVELVPRNEVARAMKMTPLGVSLAILNGTLPIGAVIAPEQTSDSTEYTTKIFKKRWELYKEGKL